MGSETVKDAARLRVLLVRLQDRMDRPSTGDDAATRRLFGRVWDELRWRHEQSWRARHQGPTPG